MKPLTKNISVAFISIALLIIAVFYVTPKVYAFSYGTFAAKVNNNRQIGNPNANVTVVVYTDFECSWCRKFEENDLPYIMSNYVKTQKVLLQFRDFPLTHIHKYAFKSAEYADCAAFQGKSKYMQIRGLLYKDQSEWSEIGDLYYFFKTKAGNIVNLKKEEACVKSGIAKKLIHKDMTSGINAEVEGTPTLFIYKGLTLYKKVTGYIPFTSLNKILSGASS